VIASGGLAQAAGHPALVHIKGEKVSFYQGARLLFEYRYSADRPKPYVHPLCAPDGTPMTLDGPPNHPHRRGLMIGWNDINGFQFWGEKGPRQGVIAHQRFDEIREKPPASITALNHWIADGNVLLVERRTVRVLPLASDHVALEWESELTAHGQAVTLSAEKHPYDGLGIRFIAGMDKGQVLNSKGTADVEHSSGEAANWCAYSGGAYGCAIFDHPANPRHPTAFFVMNQPFGYLSAAPSFREPFRLNSAESLRFRYAVLSFPGAPQRDRLDGLFKKWTA
jgi:hypothetical protein